MASDRGKISIVGTPIGNLGDMSPRAREALAAADAVCAEDTRVTGKLLAACGFSKPLVRLDEASMAAKALAIVDRAASGEVIAFCSDAGMPGVSDPGMRLIDLARARRVPVEVIPGPTAIATAYVASGTPCAAFYFGGFFPRKRGDQQRALDALRALDAALIFYESPKRLTAALEAIAAAYPHRTVTVCRELTKLHEEVVRASAGAMLEEFSQRPDIKGEVVIVIDGPSAAEAAESAQQGEAAAAALAAELAAEGMRAKEIAQRLSAACGLARNAAYEAALAAVAARDGEDAG